MDEIPTAAVIRDRVMREHRAVVERLAEGARAEEAEQDVLKTCHFCNGPADDISFDRSVCVCGSMHYFRNECGAQADKCAPMSAGESTAAGDLLRATAEIVEQREAAYGPPAVHWGKVAAMANVLWETDFFTAERIGRLWAIDKQVRDANKPDRDHLADECGYVDGIDRIRRGR